MNTLNQKLTILLFCLFTTTISLFAQPSSCDIPNEWDGFPTSSMTFMITSTAYNSLPPIQSADAYVVVLNNYNLVVGSACIADDCIIDEQQAVAIWEDDQFTEEIEGALAGDELFWYLVDGPNLYSLLPTNTVETNGFIVNGIGVIVSFDYNLECSIEEETPDEETIIEISDPCISLSDYNSILLDLNPIQKRDFNEGWNMFGFPCKESRSVAEIFSDVESDLYIIKNNEGNFYWPEFDFDGLGDLIPLEGYQTKFYNSISEFSFCDFSIDFPTINISGCTDCDACNYNPLSSHDDNSCTYKTLGYDCMGNPQEISIGQYVREYDGFVFYYDSIDDRGLIASNNILFEGSSDPYGWGSPGYEWGCFDYSVVTENEQGTKRRQIGYGPQNTQDILDVPCLSNNGGITAAQVCSEYIYGDFTEWFLPSVNELNELLLLPNIKENNSIVFPVFFWSSTESDYLPSSKTTAKVVAYSDGQSENHFDNAKNSIHKVIPIHTFGNWTEGCMDWDANNFNVDANIDNGSCTYDVSGCMDSLACNFNLQVNMADGSCEYAQEGYDCEGNILSSQYQVGDYAEGGIVFYVDESSQHGLVAAMEDLPGTYVWGCVETYISGADGIAIGTGYQNTLDIVAGCSQTPIAAGATLAFESEGYSDWYLPSSDELVEMFNTIGDTYSEVNIGGFELEPYWSSSEAGDVGAYCVYFTTGGSIAYWRGDNNSYRVRAIRAF